MIASASPPRRLAPFAVALVSTIAGLALGALVAATTDASAQDRLASFAERHNLADDASALFAHTATGGSALEKGGSRGEWVVKFKGVPRDALAFEDRPGRREEPIAMRKMLAGFFVKPGADPPNAALSLETRGGEQTLVGVELLDGRYNRDRGVARYRLRSLKQHGDQPLRLPRRFGDSSVFIDTIYNYCGVMVVRPPGSLTLQGANKYEHDDWDLGAWGEPGLDGTPPASLAAGPEFGGNAKWFGSTSGFARGCWNNAGYADENGSVEFSVRDPYTGSNTWSCTTTGAYVCDGPMDFYQAPDPKTNTSGNTVAVIYAICSTDNPNCGYDLGLVPAGYQQHACDPDCPPDIPPPRRIGAEPGPTSPGGRAP